MDNIFSWTDENEAIIATNTDATECKRCAVELGYWKDDYISYFVKHADRKAPEINRGYYARVRAMEMFIHQFLEVSELCMKEHFLTIQFLVKLLDI